MRAELGDNLTGNKGTERRAPGQTGGKGVYPSDAGFEKAPDPKYAPGEGNAVER